jgi:hypothetical protein
VRDFCKKKPLKRLDLFLVNFRILSGSLLIGYLAPSQAQLVIQTPDPTPSSAFVSSQQQVQIVPPSSPLPWTPTQAGQIAPQASPSPTPVLISPPPLVVPPGVVYVSPPYPAPGAGWVWRYHNEKGWAWHHPDRGWHKRG